MKLLKIGIATTALVLTSVQASAFTPPYHVNAGYLGKVTIQSSGSCKAKQTYENATWGYVSDSTNADVNWGIVSSNGELLALLIDFDEISIVSDSATNKKQYVYFEDMGSNETKAKIESLAGCTAVRLISSAKTKGIYKLNPTKAATFTLLYPFNGISPTLNITKGTKTTEKAQTFSGKITFKGNIPPV